MTCLALILITTGIADLGRTTGEAENRLARGFRGAILGFGAANVVVWAVSWNWWWVMAATAVAVIWIFLSETTTNIRHVALPVLLLAMSLAVLAFPDRSQIAGPFGAWIGTLPYPVLSGVGPQRLLVGLGVALVLLSTTNVAVRLVVGTTHTLVSRPSKGDLQYSDADRNEKELKGGRLIGPIERLLIAGLAVAGQFGAIGGLLAAKGIVRFPEISKSKDIEQQAEYFLVGSLTSWLVAIGLTALLYF
jgi:hypothetical protein